MTSERRRSPRYQFRADCEVTETSSETKLKGRISDLSSDGCFVDILNPSPVGAAVRITIFRADAAFTVRGIVAFALQNMGMGVKFTSVEPKESLVLQNWIAELNGLSSSTKE